MVIAARDSDGVGFLGGGAILKKGGSITGVTTAATLWIATVIGLCFGGGQLGLSCDRDRTRDTDAMGDGMDRPADFRAEHRAKLVLTTAPGAPTVDLGGLLGPTGYRARFVQQNRSQNDEEIETHFDVRWKQAAIVDPSLDFLAVVNKYCRTKSFELVSESDH